MPKPEIKEMFPYLRVKDAAEAIESYKGVFGAEESFRLQEPGGRIGHAELLLGNMTLMISDEYPEHGIHGPKDNAGTGSAIHLHVENADHIIAWHLRKSNSDSRASRPISW